MVVLKTSKRYSLGTETDFYNSDERIYRSEMYCSSIQPDMNLLVLSACYFHGIFSCELFLLPYP